MPCSRFHTTHPHHTSVILSAVIWQVATEKWGRSYPVIDSTGGSKEIIGIEQTDFVCIKGCICIVRSTALKGHKGGGGHNETESSDHSAAARFSRYMVSIWQSRGRRRL